MSLKSYLTQRGHGSGTWLADALGCFPSDVSSWVNGRRPVPARYAPAIEQLTQGEVMRWELCPHDWHEVWPEFIRHRNAPPIPARAVH